MYMWASLMLMALALAAVFLVLGGVVSKRYDTSREALTPLECGFNSVQDSRAPVSLRFFIFAVIFVVFDVELVLVLPVLLSRHEGLEVGALYGVYCMLLSAGLFLEWNNCAFEWVS